MTPLVTAYLPPTQLEAAGQACEVLNPTNAQQLRQFLTTSEPQKWATGEHQAIFGHTYLKYNSNVLGDGVCLLEVQLTVKQFYTWCNFILTIQDQHFRVCCLFGSVIFLCSQISLSFPGVGRPLHSLQGSPALQG